MAPTMRDPPPAANSNSVTCGAIEITRWAGRASVTRWPASSTTLMAACAEAANISRAKKSAFIGYS